MRLESIRIVLIFLLAVCELNAQSVSKTEISYANLPGIVRGDPVKLSDGSTIDGWTRDNGTPSTNWIAENGTLFRKSNGGDLYTERMFADFELKFEFKIEAKGNSGVKYRVKKYGDQMLGCEYQLQDDAGRSDSQHFTASLYDIFPPAKNAQPDIGGWNQATIVVCRNRIEHWLNGTMVLNKVVGSGEWCWRVSQSKFNHQQSFGQNRLGRIMLQDHGHPVWFRNIVLTPLQP